MLIRSLCARDLDSLLALYTHLHRTDLPLPDFAVVQEVWTSLMSSANDRYFGGFVDGHLVSSCALTIVLNLTRGCRPYGVIENVVTHSSHRRRGYARAVLKHALVEAWAAQCYKVMLMTGRRDEAILRFYETAGFDAGAKLAFVARPPPRLD
jgi:GNAT superfamily N-acetyltransferase